MSRAWTPEEDRILLQLVGQCKRSGMSRSQTFEMVSERLGRSSNACYHRWKILSNHRKGTELESTEKRWAERNEEYQQLKERLYQLEQQIHSNNEEMQRWIRENRKLREEMKFFEALLLEEYQLLLNLLNKNRQSARIHQLD